MSATSVVALLKLYNSKLLKFMQWKERRNLFSEIEGKKQCRVTPPLQTLIQVFVVIEKDKQSLRTQYL